MTPKTVQKAVMKKQGLSESLELPEGVEAMLQGQLLFLKKGTLSVPIPFREFSVRLEGKHILLHGTKGNKKEKRQINTFKSHIFNMIQGFDKKYVYKLQIAAVHFPMTVTYDKIKREIVIKNFLGEKIPRIAKILPDVDVKVEKEFVTLESHHKNAVGQSAANIETATRITNRDRRVFQDGIWIIEKAGEII